MRVMPCQAESSPESSGESRPQPVLELAVMPVVPAEAPRLDERLRVPRGDADGVQNAHVRELAPGRQRPYTLSVQTPRCAATSRTDSSPSRPPGSTPSARFPCSKGAAKTWRSGATGGTPWDPPTIAPLTKSLATMSYAQRPRPSPRERIPKLYVEQTRRELATRRTFS